MIHEDILRSETVKPICAGKAAGDDSLNVWHAILLRRVGSCSGMSGYLVNQASLAIAEIGTVVQS
jgi:hypothetical protein